MDSRFLPVFRTGPLPVGMVNTVWWKANSVNELLNTYNSRESGNPSSRHASDYGPVWSTGKANSGVDEGRFRNTLHKCLA